MADDSSTKSRYTLLKGQFYVFFAENPKGGPEPDGDTVRFIPNKPFKVLDLRRFGWSCPRITERGINVRFEGIDALETHFAVRLKGAPQVETHQDMHWALRARDYMLDRLGFENIQYWPDEKLKFKVQSVSNHPRPGCVLANGIDGNGRLLGFVFPPGSALQDREDGKPVYLDKPLLDQSLNMGLIKASLAYAELYTSLPTDLAGHVMEAISVARQGGEAIWASEDVSTTRASVIDGLDKLQTLVMWPKLFRRLAVFFAEGYSLLADFDPWLRQDPIKRDDRLLLPNGELGNMHDLLIIEEQMLKLRYEPERVIILPDNA